MSVTREQTPPEPPSNEELSAALAELDESRDSFLSASTRYVQTPTTANQDQLIECASQTENSLYRFCECILGDAVSDSQQKDKILVSTCVSEENQRISHFNKLFGNKADKPFELFSGDKEDPAEVITRWLESSNEEQTEGEDYDAESLLAELVCSYGHNLGIDLGQLIELTAKSPQARALNACKFIGRHSLEVVKISAGVVIGSFIVRELERRKS